MFGHFKLNKIWILCFTDWHLLFYEWYKWQVNIFLVGHGLENDFRALMLVHALVVDTSNLFPHFFGLPYRRSLKSLAKSYLKRDIQTGTHDSLEDARASLELVLCKVMLLEYEIHYTSEITPLNGICWQLVSWHFSGQGWEWRNVKSIKG